MKQSTLILLLLFTSQLAAQNWNWRHEVHGGLNYELFTLDESGNVVLTGQRCPDIMLEDDIITGQQPAESCGNIALRYSYIAVLNPNGELLNWFDFPGINLHHTTSKDGYFYCGGSFKDTLQLGGNTYIAASEDADALVFKMDEQGTIIWVQTIGSERTDWVQTIVVSDSGHCFVGGLIGDSTYIGAEYVEVENYSDSFVAAIDENGEFVWVKLLESSSVEYITQVKLDPSGNVLAAGQYWSTLTVDTLSTSSEKGVYLVKLSPDGNLVFLRAIAGNGSLIGEVAIGDNSDIYISGGSPAVTDFSGTIDEKERRCGFLAKYTPTGEVDLIYRDTAVTYFSSVQLNQAEDKIYLAGEAITYYLPAPVVGHHLDLILQELTIDGTMIAEGIPAKISHILGEFGYGLRMLYGPNGEIYLQRKYGVAIFDNVIQSPPQYESSFTGQINDLTFITTTELDIVDAVEDEETSSAFQVSVFPNPITDMLYVHLYHPHLTGAARFELMDASGKVVLHFESRHGDVTHMVPVGHLAAGVYWLQCGVGQEAVVRSVVVGR